MGLARITVSLFRCVWRAARSLSFADALSQGLVPLDEIAAVFPASPRRFPARPVSSDKLVAMAGFDDEDAWDMECSIDLKISASLRTRPRKFEEFQSAIVELPLIFGMDEVAAVFRASPGRFPRVQ